MGVTLWAMLSQALFTDVQRACRAAVQRVAVYYALLGMKISSTNTGAYCRARAKVPEGVAKRLTVGLAERCEESLPDEWSLGTQHVRHFADLDYCGDLAILG